MPKNTNFFLLIEDYGYSKSRTKIGVSVDIKVWEKTQKLCGINPSQDIETEKPSQLTRKENANFFLLIEDYGYSKSRTKIGVSVDTKVWEIAQKLCGIKIIHSQIFDPLTDIWSIHRNFNSRCFKYVW